MTLVATTTVIFSLTPHLTEGSALTRSLAEQRNKSYLHLHPGMANPRAALLTFLRQYSIHVLNVAGPRASSEPEVEAFVKQVLNEAIG
jgi:hypothetical protein